MRAASVDVRELCLGIAARILVQICVCILKRIDNCHGPRIGAYVREEVEATRQSPIDMILIEVAKRERAAHVRIHRVLEVQTDLRCVDQAGPRQRHDYRLVVEFPLWAQSNHADDVKVALNMVDGHQFLASDAKFACGLISRLLANAHLLAIDGAIKSRSR